MRAIAKKLKSRGGATLLMALLFFLVAVMVSTVIISAANTATKNLAARRSSQQAYLDVSSAAQYLRDAIQTEDAFCAEVVKTGVTGTDPDGTKRELKTTQRGGTIQVVDALFRQAVGNDVLAPFPVTLQPLEKAYTITVGTGMTVNAALKLEITEVPEDEKENKYLKAFTLTAEFSTPEDSETPCRINLKMRGGILHETIENQDQKAKTERYQLDWPVSQTELWRQGLGEDTQ